MIGTGKTGFTQGNKEKTGGKDRKAGKRNVKQEIN